MNQPDYLGLSIIELSVFLYNYVEPKYEKKQNYFMWTLLVLLSK